MNVADKYGLDMSGATDNAPKLAHMAADIAALYAAKKPLPRLTFPEGIVSFSVWPDLAYDNLQLVAEGECRLAGEIIFDASLRNPKASEPGIANLLFDGFDVYAPLTFRGIHRSKLSVRVLTDVAPSGPAIAITFCIITELHPVVRGGYPIGVLLNAWPGKPNLQSTACTIWNPCLENCAVGLDMESAGSCAVYGGTIESCNLGVHLGAACGDNMFYSVEMEGNLQDVTAANGAHNNGFMYCGNSSRLNTNFGLFSSNWSKN